LVQRKRMLLLPQQRRRRSGLQVASRHGYKVPKEALADTTDWLLKPAGWDKKGVSGDEKIARIQFAAALVEAVDAGFVKDREPLNDAAASLLRFQNEDGSWQVDQGALGSPVNYGTAIATYMARRTLEAAYSDRFTDALIKANLWFLRTTPKSVLDEAAVLLALPSPEPGVRRCLDLLLSAQSSEGGWGPYPQARAEPFDTAVVLLALQKLNEPDRTGNAIARGRAFLAGQQQPTGGWTETTRPAGGRSYAQHISTSAWATLALILTDSKR